MRVFSRSVRYFEVVARTGSIRSAAELLHVAPSAISRAVQQLEEEITVELFDRTAHGLQLTAAGEIALAYMQRWTQETEHLADALTSLTGARLETVRVATVEVATYELVPQAVGTVRQLVPGLGVALMVGDTQAVLDSMLSRSADIGVVINMPKKVPVRSLWSMSTPVGLIVPRHHRLASRQSVRMIECLAAEPLIMPEEPLIARSAIRSALESAGPYRIAASSNRIVAIKALLRAGLGITFLARLDIGPEERTEEFSFVPLDDRAIEHPYISIVVPRGVKRSAATDLLLETLRRAMPNGEFRG